MAKTPKRPGGPTTAEGKAISSANAVTHGLTSKRWLNDDEQSLDDVHLLPNGHPALLLKRSKTDQYGDGKIIPISNELDCLIEQWKRELKEDKGFILRGFKRNLKPNRQLNASSINTILKKLQQKVGMKDQCALSGHSFRVGTALDLLEKGMSIEKIMLKGGWKSESSAMRYLRSWNEINSLLR